MCCEDGDAAPSTAPAAKEAETRVLGKSCLCPDERLSLPTGHCRVQVDFQGV